MEKLDSELESAKVGRKKNVCLSLWLIFVPTPVGVEISVVYPKLKFFVFLRDQVVNTNTLEVI